MKNKQLIEQHPFAFMFRINGNPICERFFNIHNYNPDVLHSIELIELMDTIIGTRYKLGIIPKFLKERSDEYLWFFYERSKYTLEPNQPTTNRGKKDVYTFEIKVNSKIIAEGLFEGDLFPPKIRYKVELKKETDLWGEDILDEDGNIIPLDIIPSIINEIKETFTQDTYTQEFGEYSLVTR